MSEEISPEEPILCATEKDFDEFQSVSMCEEDEFITLSDIVSPKPAIPGMLDGLPFDNDDDLDSTADSQISNEISNEQSKKELRADNSNANYELQKPIVISLSNSPKKRGRPKKKCTVERGTLPSQILRSSEKLDALDTSVNKIIKKRGRKKKSDIENDVKEMISLAYQKSSSEFSSQSAIPSKSVKKRGRKKKSFNELETSVSQLCESSRSELNVQNPNFHENLEISPEISKNVESYSNRPSRKIKPKTRYSPVLCQDLQPTPNTIADEPSSSKVKKRGRKKKMLNQNEQYSYVEKTIEKQKCLPELNDNITKNNLDENSTTIQSNRDPADQNMEYNHPDLCNDILNEVVSSDTDKMAKKFKKRKRTSEQTPNEPRTVASHSDDDNDNISLSKLKKIQSSQDNSLVDSTQWPFDKSRQSSHGDSVIDNQHPTESMIFTKVDNSLDNPDISVAPDSTDDFDTIIKAETITAASNGNYISNNNFENSENNLYNEESVTELMEESLSKRPVRRRAKKNIVYHQDESDEDPFANIASSEDDEPRKKKGSKYYSDEEYVPGKKNKKGKVASESYSDDDDDDSIDMMEEEWPKRKLSTAGLKKISANVTQSPKVATIAPNHTADDIENCLQSSVILASNNSKGTWGTNEFESFLAKKVNADLKIKKVSSSVSADSVKTSLEIPVIDPTQPKKYIETCTQTKSVSQASTSTQTSSTHEVSMKQNVTLTKEQSTKACEFLRNFVQTTAELGQLMTEKSEDFIKKKINEQNVTDTFKMDYCIKKSYLLFKLAKSNLMQMEEDLTKQYDEFLKENKLSEYREQVRNITPKPKANDSDSDCEIVDVAPSKITNSKPVFNPKTVFLNKELSIKIAKKPTEEKTKKPTEDKAKNIKQNLNIKGKHSVWINDSIMVKKVKPTQSFLAQDSRNKKPPDCVLSTIVSNFFKHYNWCSAAQMCAPYVALNGIPSQPTYVCNYFFIKTDNIPYSHESGTSNLNHNSITNLESFKSYEPKMPVNPKTLFSLCLEVLQLHVNSKALIHESNSRNIKPSLTSNLSLVQLCIKAINFFPCADVVQSYSTMNKVTDKDTQNRELPSLRSITLHNVQSLIMHTWHHRDIESIETTSSPVKETNNNVIEPNEQQAKVNSLLSICVSTIQHLLKHSESSEEQKAVNLHAAFTLKFISFKKITQCMYSKAKEHTELNFNGGSINKDTEERLEEVRINFVNTLTEDAFVNMDSLSGDECSDLYAENDNSMSDNGDFGNDEPDYSDFAEEQSQNNWEQDTHVQELKPCISNFSAIAHVENNEETPLNVLKNINNSEEPEITHIKIEPIDDIPESLLSPNAASSVVKPEPGLNQMTIIPESIVMKQEIPENDQSNNHLISNFDVETFESFVRSHKLINSLECNMGQDEIFSQSGLRVHRQHEPDYYNENDNNLSLLIPHASQPFNVTKNTLMQSSSEDENEKSNNSKKKTEKKRSRPKKSTNKDVITHRDKLQQQQQSINVDKERDVDTEKRNDKAQQSDIAVLTRKMKGKIRQEEKKIESSDSETENLPLTVRAEKGKKKAGGKQKPETKTNDAEIQCNNIDSTENDSEKNILVKDDKFSGFSAVDQCEMSSYQKYVNFMYDKILQKKPSEPETSKNVIAPPDINPDEPVEYLECEPSMPFMDSDTAEKSDSKPKSRTKIKKVTNKVKTHDIEPKPAVNKAVCRDRDRWSCYPIDKNDTKLYTDVYVPLEKLPETFVETYFQFQEITSRNNDDLEIDKLTNLHSLKRNLKETIKEKWKMVIKPKKTEPRSETNSGVVSPTFSDHQAELTPSEDEGDTNDEGLLPLAPVRHTENALAKNSLMDDNESDSDGNPNLAKDIKMEPHDDSDHQPLTQKRRPGPKSKTRPQVPENTENLMLTADKVMQKDLALLHAPVQMEESVPETESPKKGMTTRPKTRHSYGRSKLKSEIKNEEDSSSEEEKQWVSTKEKLLKRISKKPEDTSVEDAKRAKLVSEFIEKRGAGGMSESHKRMRMPRMRSRKKFLERQKQLNILSRELYGENAADPAHPLKRSAAYFKGRRNIRKVIDKKSLARSTVLANMQEFERKRRISMKQNQLREVLGCEEDVNVLVINDEVCLEYDFNDNRPVVSIHPFFTKVMKAHQYEGVKFMWDACFESLERISNGDPGGGCILAHCMGLGKTLQVLALLHTVLTHPRVGMHRVLVCCPLSTVLNWVDEIHKWIGPVTDQIKVFELSKLKKTYERAYQLEDWYNGGGIFIIGYELFRSLSTLDPLIDEVRPTIVNKIRAALLDPGPDIIVCDEGHLLKNDCSVLAVAMSRVATKRRIVLTGTPMQNNLREYYCMVNFIKPNLLGTYSEYSNRFENPIMNGQHRDSREEDIKLMKARTHILHKVLEGCLQRQEASVLYPYLPKKYEYTVFISLTECQSKMYKHYLESESGTKNKNRVLRDFHILQKIWTHPQVLHNFMMKPKYLEEAKVKPEKLEDDLAHEDLTAHEDVKPPETRTWWLQYCANGAMIDSLESSHKMQAVFKILEECSHIDDKVLLFSTSLYTMDTIEYFLKNIKDWSLGQEYYRLDGSVPVEVRQKWCREFNAENNHRTRLFLISTRAGCLGLNMVAANRVIIMDTSWNPAHDIQSIFRVYRFGQKKDCHIYRLVALGTMEQKIYERSVTKQAVACRVVDEQQIDRHYNSADLTELYKFDEHGTTVAAGVASGVRDVVLLRVACSAAVHAVHEHDSLLRGSTEPALNETERDAAWTQFQQEHANKQVQNGIASSMSIHILSKEYTVPIEPKTEPVSVPPPEPANVPKKYTGKKTKDKPEPSEKEAHSLQYNTLVGQITSILISEKFHEVSKKNISEVVEMVRKIVTVNKLTQVSKDYDSVAISVATALFNSINECPPMLTDVAPGLSRRGRPRKPLSLIMGLPDEPKPKPATVTSINQLTPTDSVQITRKRRNLLTGLSFPTTLDKSATPTNSSIVTKRLKLLSRPINKTSNSPMIGSSETESKKELHDIPDNNSYVSTDEDRPLVFRLKRKRSTVANSHKKSVQESGPATKKMIKTGRDEQANTSVPTLETDSGSYLAEDDFDSDNDNQIETQNLSDSGDIILISDKDGQSPNSKEPPITENAAPRKRGRPRKIQQGKISDSNSIPNTVISDTPKPNPPKASVESKSDYNTRHAKKIQKAVMEKSNQVDLAESVQSEPEPVIPLHPSLLRNENFVKIVAHTYLTGNPCLDEDAATLAARYSTHKALREIETTGMELCSGPIYDIAVKVLGIPVLMKLQENDKAERSKPPTEPVQLKPGPLSKKKILLESKSSIPVSVTITESQNTRKPESSNIVPIKLTKSDPNTESNVRGEECESILPDDDEVVMTSVQPASVAKPGSAPKLALLTKAALAPKRAQAPKPATATKPAPAVKPAPTPKIQVRSCNQFLKVSLADNSVKTEPKINQPLRVTSGPKPVASAQKPVQESILSDMICLDSDEDEPVETVTPGSVPPGPVPVSLVAATPAALAALPPHALFPRAPAPVAPKPQLTPPANAKPIVLTNAQIQKIQQSGKKLIVIPQSQINSLNPGINIAPNQINSINPAISMGSLNNMGMNIPINLNPLNLGMNINPGMDINALNAGMMNIESGMNTGLINMGMNNPLTTGINMNAMNVGGLSMVAPVNKQTPVYQSTESANDDIQVIEDEAPTPHNPPPTPADNLPSAALPKPEPTRPKPGPLSKKVAATKTVCKPGDILRITKTGGVEVLSRESDIEDIINIDDNDVKDAGASVSNTTKQYARKVVKDTTAEVKEQSKVESAKEKETTSRLRSRSGKTLLLDSPSSESSSDDSRPSSPADPMSVLRNVVRIEAAIDNSSSPKPSKTTPQPKLDPFKDKIIKNLIPKLQTNKSLSTPINKTTQKAKETVVSKDVAKIEGNSRTITISGSGKAKTLPFPSVDLTGTPSIQVTKVQKLPPLPAKASGSKATDAKKRHPSSDLTPSQLISSKIIPPAPKKAKQPMTLKDFNLDDIDDIIELE